MSARTRRFARWSAIGSLLLGMAGQVACHLLTRARTAHAPSGITTAVSCLPVLVLGMGATLTHLLRADAHQLASPRQGNDASQNRGRDRTDSDTGNVDGATRPDRLAQAQVAAAQLTAAGQRMTRRALRQAGLQGSNADLGRIAQILKPQAAKTSAAMNTRSKFRTPAG